MTYIIIFIVLLIAELAYFKIADRCNIIDRPNERSSHSSVVLRGGGIVFCIGIIIWLCYSLIVGKIDIVLDMLPFISGMILISFVSFIDDVRSLSNSIRLATQFIAMILLLFNVFSGIVENFSWIIVLLMMVVSLVICVGAVNIFNFMDGINGITAGYSLAVLISLLIINNGVLCIMPNFVDNSFLITVILSVMVFSIFNFRNKGKAKCFAGDVGSIGMAFILLFVIGKLILSTKDVSWLIFLVVYGIDGCLTIIHRIMLHENLGEGHRKHAFQLMANELGVSHVAVSLMYMILQLSINLGMIYVVRNTCFDHWVYLICVVTVLMIGYVTFMRKYYHLHADYLKNINKK